ncbi:MAG: arylsulfatase [Planctomycetota bacterium]|jgi:arylsulfatase
MTTSKGLAPRSRPNVVLILVDDMGYSDIGCYGSEIETPNIDALAATGVRFTQTYNCARCCPSRAALLTGLYPHQAGVGHMTQDRGLPGYRGLLDDRCVTLAEVLRPSGYFTGLSGKWHVGGFWPRGAGEEARRRLGDPTKPLPPDRGFDRFFGAPTGGSYFNPAPLFRDRTIIEPEGDYYHTDAIAENACAMIGEGVAAGKPFFIHVTFTAPHWPLHARPEDTEKFRGRYLKGWDAVRTARHEELKGLGLLEAKWPISARDPDAPPWEDAAHPDWQDARMAVYAAQIHRMDAGVGRILDTLRERGVEDDTLVMFCSDNGGCAEFLAENGRKESELPFTRDGRPVRVGNSPEIEPGGADTFMSYDLPWANASNSPFRLFKHWVHEGGISTPLVARWPGVAPEGAVRHEPNHFVDVAATVIDVSGAPYPREFGGRPVTPLAGESFGAALRGDPWSRERPIFFEHEGNRAVRAGRWKIVSKHPGPWELYDMAEDRTETVDLAGRNAGKVEELAALYGEWAAESDVLPWDEVRSRRR